MAFGTASHSLRTRLECAVNHIECPDSLANDTLGIKRALVIGVRVGSALLIGVTLAIVLSMLT
jgi:hypothetical protein